MLGHQRVGLAVEASRLPHGHAVTEPPCLSNGVNKQSYKKGEAFKNSRSKEQLAE